MNSFRSRLIIWMIRNRHLFKLKAQREFVDENFDIEGFRKKTDEASNRMNKAIQEDWVKAVKIGSIYGEWVQVGNEPFDKVILYIHGGGFISGSCHTHRAHVLKFVKGSGIKALVFDYRLAPEHPYPAALEDCIEVYRWLLEQGYESKNILLAGESAGATLVLTTLLKIKDQQLGLPKAAVSISPVTDLRSLADSFTRSALKDIATLNAWHVWQAMYVGNASYLNPFISPLFGDLKGLPPTYICIGSHEVHYDDAIAIYKKMKEAGVEVQLHDYEGMVHAFPIMAPIFPEATKALEEICSFIRLQLSCDT